MRAIYRNMLTTAEQAPKESAFEHSPAISFIDVPVDELEKRHQSQNTLNAGVQLHDYFAKNELPGFLLTVRVK